MSWGADKPEFESVSIPPAIPSISLALNLGGLGTPKLTVAVHAPFPASSVGSLAGSAQSLHVAAPFGIAPFVSLSLETYGSRRAGSYPASELRKPRLPAPPKPPGQGVSGLRLSVASQPFSCLPAVLGNVDRGPGDLRPTSEGETGLGEC